MAKSLNFSLEILWCYTVYRLACHQKIFDKESMTNNVHRRIVQIRRNNPD
jgi:hypothetical protein